MGADGAGSAMARSFGDSWADMKAGLVPGPAGWLATAGAVVPAEGGRLAGGLPQDRS